ncbi:hypothetical protein [Candidatus Solincola sp.]|jgi:hypothetical protein|nr:hypothetical protein [Actinomycetota bacterium]MDI7251399.1 hypothetical protein [Actinomycetota bacterium]
MKYRLLIFIPASVFLLSIGLLVGCSRTEVEGTRGQDSGSLQTDPRYQDGYGAGFREGYKRGYADGGLGAHDPQPETDPGWDPYYASGYRDGFLEGYEKGYARARGEAAEREEEGEESGDEMAEVEAAMLAFAKFCSSSGLEFRIQDIVIHGDEAAGIAVCTNEILEHALVIVRKGPSGWYGVDFGTGIEPPPWYPYY